MVVLQVRGSARARMCPYGGCVCVRVSVVLSNAVVGAGGGERSTANLLDNIGP
jgi:hypothetical protein